MTARLVVCLLALAASTTVQADEQLTNNRHKDSAPVISPDGTTLLFLSEQINCDISRLDLSTGEISLLTDDPAREDHVRFAPDGSRVAYLVTTGLDTHVVVHPLPDGPPRDLGPGDDLEWSPEGRWLASRDDRGIFLLDPDTGERDEIAAATPGEPGSIHWRRTGEELLYLHEGDIWGVSIHDRVQRKLFSSKVEDERANFRGFAIAPGGEQIVAVLDLSRLSLKSEDEGLLLRADSDERVRLGPMRSPIWRDSDTLIFSRGGSIHQMSLGGEATHVAGSDNSADEPALTPDGEWLYFSARQPERRTSGGLIPPKYSEIYRDRLTD